MEQYGHDVDQVWRDHVQTQHAWEGRIQIAKESTDLLPGWHQYQRQPCVLLYSTQIQVSYLSRLQLHSRFWRGTFGVLLPWSTEKVLQFGSTIVVLYFAVQFLYCYLEVQFLYFILLYNFCTSNLLYNYCTTFCCTTFVPPFWSTVFIPLADSTIFVQFLRSAFFLQVLSTIIVQLLSSLIFIHFSFVYIALFVEYNK